MHFEIDFGTWDTPDKLHQSAALYIQRGKDGYAKREELKVAPSDMFRAELEMFADMVATGKAPELSADNANVAVAVVYAALRSIDQRGECVKLADVFSDARAKIEANTFRFEAPKSLRREPEVFLSYARCSADFASCADVVPLRDRL